MPIATRFPDQRGKQITNNGSLGVPSIQSLVHAHLEIHVLNLKAYQQALLELLGHQLADSG